MTLAACGGIASGGSVKVVSYLPSTDAARAVTQPVVHAVTQAFEEKDYRTCGGRWTIQYEARPEITDALRPGEPAALEASAKTYVADRGVVAVIGVYDSDSAKIVLPILNPDSLVFISATGTYPGLTKAGLGAPGEPDVYYPTGVRNYARVAPTDDVQGPAAARWARELGARSAYVLDDLEPYGRGVADAFEAALERIGLELVGRESIDSRVTDFTPVATKITRLGPDLVYFGGTTETGGGYLIRDLRAVGYQGLIMGAEGIRERRLLEIAGGAADGVYVTSAGIPPEGLGHTAGEWRAGYRARYGSEPGDYAAYGYVAAAVLLDAFERVCAGGGAPTDRNAVREAVLGTRDFPSVIGKFSIDANGDTTLAALYGSQVQDGAFHFVARLAGG